MTDKRKREARAIMAETGWNYTRALREADRRHAEVQAEAQDGSDEEDRSRHEQRDLPVP